MPTKFGGVGGWRRGISAYMQFGSVIVVLKAQHVGLGGGHGLAAPCLDRLYHLRSSVGRRQHDVSIGGVSMTGGGGGSQGEAGVGFRIFGPGR